MKKQEESTIHMPTCQGGKKEFLEYVRENSKENGLYDRIIKTGFGPLILLILLILQHNIMFGSLDSVDSET